MRFFATLSALSLSLAVLGSAHAADDIQSAIVGSWKLTAIYDVASDGTRRNNWGADPQGLVTFTANGMFSALIVAGDRAPKPGVPSEPTGPALAYYGTYTVNEEAKSFVTSVQQSTFPQWKGLALARTVEALDATQLKIKAAPVKDPKGGEFVPHLEFTRIK